jgi:hypothetical protein
MPRRISDGEAAWGSNKIAILEPSWVRAEYAWLHSLAGPNGCLRSMRVQFGHADLPGVLIGGIIGIRLGEKLFK